MAMWEGKMVTTMLVVNQVLYVGGNTLCKAAMARGMSNFIFIVYTHFLAFLFLLPSAFFCHRTNPLPPITLYTILRLVLLGLVSYCCSIFLYIGINYSSPTLASAMVNLSPAITFTLAIIFGMEMLKVRSKSSFLKIIGATISVVGALIMIFYKGLPIVVFQPSSPLISIHLQPILTTNITNWIIGGILLLTSTLFLSLVYIIKTWIVRDFNSDVVATVIFIFFETIIATMVALVVENGPNVWIPSTTIELMAILFGALEVGVINVVHTWACRKKGPVFAVIFKPLQLMIAVIFGITFLSETLHLGSIIGGLTIAIGFYSVMKGKAEEEILHIEVGDSGEDTEVDFESVYYRVPLLNPKP